jgi:hypothetical protein
MNRLAAVVAVVAVVVAAVPVPAAGANDCWETFETEPGERIEVTSVSDDRTVVTVLSSDWSLRFLRDAPAIQTEVPETHVYLRVVLLGQAVAVAGNHNSVLNRSVTYRFVYGGRVAEFEVLPAWLSPSPLTPLWLIPTSRDDRLGRHARLCR